MSQKRTFVLELKNQIGGVFPADLKNLSYFRTNIVFPDPRTFMDGGESYDLKKIRTITFEGKLFKSEGLVDRERHYALSNGNCVATTKIFYNINNVEANKDVNLGITLFITLNNKKTYKFENNNVKINNFTLIQTSKRGWYSEEEWLKNNPPKLAPYKVNTILNLVFDAKHNDEAEKHLKLQFNIDTINGGEGYPDGKFIIQ